MNRSRQQNDEIFSNSSNFRSVRSGVANPLGNVQNRVADTSTIVSGSINRQDVTSIHSNATFKPVVNKPANEVNSVRSIVHDNASTYSTNSAATVLFGHNNSNNQPSSSNTVVNKPAIDVRSVRSIVNDNASTNSAATVLFGHSNSSNNNVVVPVTPVVEALKKLSVSPAAQAVVKAKPKPSNRTIPRKTIIVSRAEPVNISKQDMSAVGNFYEEVFLHANSDAEVDSLTKDMGPNIKAYLAYYEKIRNELIKLGKSFTNEAICAYIDIQMSLTQGRAHEQIRKNFGNGF